MGDPVTKGILKNHGSRLEEHKRDGRSDSVGLLQTLETSLDDIRTLITCRVCVRPLFEPYTIECGHTFCYGCLVRWFERDQTKKSCPDCRSDVLRPPAPAYLVRDMTQIFANRAELMPVGETTQQHKEWQEEEAALVETDKSTTGLKGGLFRGCFKLTRRRQLPAIRDDEDGVDRCPRCTWELEDGLCESCGYPAGDDSADMSDSDGRDRWDDEIYDVDGATMEELVGALGDEVMGGRVPNPDYSEHEYTSEDRLSDTTLSQIRRRNRRIAAQLDRLQAHPDEEPTYDSFLEDSDEDEDSDDEEDGSLDGFIINDIEDGPHSVRSSSRSLQWETDEGTAVDGDQPQNPHLVPSSQYEGSSDERLSPHSQYSPEDESDEGPILRSRRQARQRSVGSNQSSGSDGRNVSQALDALRMRTGHNGSRIPANTQRTITHRDPDVGGERSTIGPIEIESDSDSPVPAQHTRRRRRAVPNRISSDRDSDVEASSGTATVGRDSPRSISNWINSRNGGIQPVNQTSNASSHNPIQSSPTPSAEREFAVPGAFPQRQRTSMPQISHYTGRGLTRANRRDDNSLRESSTRPPPASASPIYRLQQGRGARGRSPLPPRSHAHSPAPRQLSHSPTAMEMFEQGKRDRQAQKNERRAERRRTKAEREQRRGPQSGPSSSPRFMGSIEV